MTSFDNYEKIKKREDRFYEELRDRKKWINYVRIKNELGTAGPNSLKSKVSRSTLSRIKKSPVTLPKMSWDK
jgi:hypothetical protein